MRYLLLGILMAAAAQAQTVTTVANFYAALENPYSLIQGADGNFYGSTMSSVVFKMLPVGVLSSLYSSPNSLVSDLNPVIQGQDGNFYGTTQVGGNGNCDFGGCGSVFELTPGGTLTTLYSFQGSDGFFPLGSLIQGSDGNFYGVTAWGGASYNSNSNGEGTIFQLTPAGVLTRLHNFSGQDGSYPDVLIQGADGNLYGMTQYGGTGSCPGMYVTYTGCGTIFKITPGGTFASLYSFPAATNSSSFIYTEALIQASNGNFYGTTPFGGSGNCPGQGQPGGCGVIFQMTPSGTVTTLHNFDMTDGLAPSSVIQGNDGNFYGTAQFGGAGSCQVMGSPNGCGTLFRITPAGEFTTLYNFGLIANDGTNPQSLLQATNGKLYGTASSGGTFGLGTVFDLSIGTSTSPVISSVVNGASFQPGIAAGAWVTISGTNLSSITGTWDDSIINGALPTTLDSVSVIIGDQPAYIEYISATQVNALAPNVPAGSVQVTVTTANGTSQAVNAQLSAEQPAFFQWGTYAVATHQDYSLAVKNGTFAGTTTVPAKPGDVIILWGTGFGATSPSAPAGMETPSTTTYNTATGVNVTIGGKSATVYGAALAPGYAGLYQIAIQIPAGLANGDYPVVAAIAGVQSPSTTLITVQQ